jgi:hypothetical protein
MTKDGTMMHVGTFHRITKALAWWYDLRSLSRGWIELPEWYGESLYASTLSKGVGHKYIRRVPIPGKVTKTGKQVYRYFYRTVGGRGLGHHDEMVVGAAFKMRDGGKDGHFHITQDHGDGHVTIRHDETGQEHKIHKDALASMLHNEHVKMREEDAANERAKRERAKQRALADLEAAKKYGSAKHVEAARKRAKEAGHVELEPKSVYVPMTDSEMEIIYKDKKFHSSLSDLMNWIRDNKKLEEVPGGHFAIQKITQKLIDKLPGDQAVKDFRDEIAKIKSSADFKKIDKERRREIVSELAELEKRALALEHRIIELQLYSPYGHYSNAGYNARNAHRQRILSHVKDVMGPATVSFLTRNPASLGSIALGEIKTDVELAKHIDDLLVARSFSADHAIEENGEGEHNKSYISEVGEDAARLADELERQGYQMPGARHASELARKAIKAIEEARERARHKAQKEKEAREAAKEEALKKRQESAIDLSKFHAAVASAAPLPDKPIDADKQKVGKNAIKRLERFVSKDANKPYLAGVHGDGQYAYASDGFRAVMVKSSDVPPREGYPNVKGVLLKPENVSSVHSMDAGSLHALSNVAIKHVKAHGYKDEIPKVIFKRSANGDIHASIYDAHHDVKPPSIKVEGKTHQGPHSGDLPSDGVTLMNAKYLKDALDEHKGAVSIKFSKDHNGPIEIHRQDGERHLIMPIRK